MKKIKLHLFLLLLLLVMGVWAEAQEKVMQVHRDGSVVYEVNTAQVDSITFKAEKDCEELQPAVLTDQLKAALNAVFSRDNEPVENIKGDTLLCVINSEEDLLNINPNPNTVDIDFENQSLIWGKVLTSSISDNISTKQLFECNDDTSYKYDVQIEKCTECMDAEGYHYFWGIYDRKISRSDILLTVKQ